MPTTLHAEFIAKGHLVAGPAHMVPRFLSRVGVGLLVVAYQAQAQVSLVLFPIILIATSYT